MKKSLLALAVLGAFAGAASAQSSVTIYGKVDLGVAKANRAAAGAATLTGAPSTGEVEVQQGASSRVGFRGMEDLGGGLKGIFNLEHRFLPDTGATTTTGAVGNSTSGGFWNQAWLGLAGNFGEVRLGRDYAPAFYVQNAFDPFGNDTVAQAGTFHGMTPAGQSRQNNQVSYKTPDFMGLTAQLAVSPDEREGGRTGWGANVMYKAGAMNVAFGYQQTGTFNATTSATAPFAFGVSSAAVGTAGTTLISEADVYLGGVSFDFGVVRPMILVSRSVADSAVTGVEAADFRNVQVGLTAPLAGGEVKALVARLKRDTFGGGADVDLEKAGLGYHYALSKRTKVYVDGAAAWQDGLVRRTAMDIGVQHNF